jgi:hypothetical protein
MDTAGLPLWLTIVSILGGSTVLAAVIREVFLFIRERCAARERHSEERRARLDAVVSLTRDKLHRVIYYCQYPEKADDWSNEWRGADETISQARGVAAPHEIVTLMEELQRLVRLWAERANALPNLGKEEEQQRRQRLLEDYRFQRLLDWAERHGGDIRTAYDQMMRSNSLGWSWSPSTWLRGRNLIRQVLKIRQSLEREIRQFGIQPSATWRGP